MKAKKHVVNLFVIALLTMLLKPGISWAKTKEEKPNVIFIICDQMRGDAFGAAGNSRIHTPNIDKLAENGVMFNNNFTNNPVCLPSRVSMFSGRYPHQTGVLCNKSKGELLHFQKSLPWYFKQAGYRIGYVGKNHTYISSELKNFDFVDIRAREECRAYSKYVPPYWHSDMLWPEEDCNPRKNTDDAINFINQNEHGEPFFLHISYFDPHPPYMAPAEYTSKYCSDDMILPDYIDPAKLSDRLAEQQKALHYDKVPEADLKETMRYYYASVEWGVDYQIGRIMKALEEKGLDKNTIIVFTSDHGDFMGEHHMVRKAMFHYDALLHVPMIWYAPSYIKKDYRPENLSQNVDIFPTLLDLAGIDIPEQLVGRSLVKVLQGKQPADKNFTVFASAAYSDLPKDYWENPEPYFESDNDIPFHSRVQDYTWNEENRTVMARNLNWKLILNETREPELYFMNGGHIERENLYGNSKYEDIYQSLKSKIDSLWSW